MASALLAQALRLVLLAVEGSNDALDAALRLVDLCRQLGVALNKVGIRLAGLLDGSLARGLGLGELDALVRKLRLQLGDLALELLLECARRVAAGRELVLQALVLGGSLLSRRARRRRRGSRVRASCLISALRAATFSSAAFCADSPSALSAATFASRSAWAAEASSAALMAASFSAARDSVSAASSSVFVAICSLRLAISASAACWAEAPSLLRAATLPSSDAVSAAASSAAFSAAALSSARASISCRARPS